MSKEEVMAQLEMIEQQMREIKKRIASLESENGQLRTTLSAVDDRTKQFKPWTQTSHPDFDLGA